MKFGLFSAGLPHKNKGPDAVEYSTSQLDDADMTKKEFRRALYQAVHDNDVERVNASTSRRYINLVLWTSTIRKYDEKTSIRFRL